MSSSAISGGGRAYDLITAKPRRTFRGARPCSFSERKKSGALSEQSTLLKKKKGKRAAGSRPMPHANPRLARKQGLGKKKWRLSGTRFIVGSNEKSQIRSPQNRATPSSMSSVPTKQEHAVRSNGPNLELGREKRGSRARREASRTLFPPYKRNDSLKPLVKEKRIRAYHWRKGEAKTHGNSQGLQACAILSSAKFAVFFDNPSQQKRGASGAAFQRPTT